MLKILKKVLAFSRDQKKALTKGIVFGFFNAIFKICNIMAIAYVLQNIINKTANLTTVFGGVGIMLVGVVGATVMNYVSTMNLTHAGYTMAADSRISIAEHLRKMSMGFFNDNNLGKITSVATNSAEQINDNLTRCLMFLAQGIFMSSIIAISMLFFDYRMGLLCILGIVLYLIIASYQQKHNKAISYTLVESVQILVNNILEYIQGISVVKSYNIMGDSNKKVKEAITSTKNTFFKLEVTFIPIIAMQTLIFRIISFLMITLSIIFYIGGSMDLFTAIMMSICSFLLFSDLELSNAFGSLLRMIEGSINEINDVLDAKTMDDEGETEKIDSYDIELKNVDFSYDTKKIIDNVSLSIPKNSTLAIVGGSGSGKTTLCNLITRFWDVDGGQITIGGKDIRKVGTDELLSKFTMVFQNVYLFNDTIANNVKFGKQDATKEEIEEACKKACCHDFIMELPNGYDTIIGEGGASISGGEKQRISIARAIIKDAPIVILDEATANVDPENEHKLQQAIQELTRSKTVIMIAHRLKTVKNADKIIVLEDGKLIESGKHEELLSNGGVYSDFVGMRKKSIGWKLGRM